MAITPDTNIKLLKCPLTLSNKNQLTFASKTTQYNYFNSLPKLEVEECSYQRKDNIIRYPAHIDDIIEYNYVMYQNNNYGDKWFYGYIENMEYENDGLTNITIRTDVYQTWQFDINFKNSFVEREHVNNDEIGANIVDEGLQVGEYVNAENPVKILDSINDFKICMAVTEMPDGNIPSFNETRLYNGIFSGLFYIAFPTTQDAETAIKIYDSQAKANAIQYLFLVPSNLQSISGGAQGTWTVGTVGTCNVIYLSDSNNADNPENLIGNMPTHVGENYIPKNNKLFIYPYNFCTVTNNNGISENFNYEDFIIDTSTGEKNFSFWLDCAICPGMSMKLIPLQYKNINFNYEYAISGAKLPICSWNSDTYINWLTSQCVNLGINTFSSVASLNPVGIVSDVANSLGSIYQANIIPNQARGNTNSGDVSFSEGLCGFTLYYISIKDEYAKIIDDYFSMYGYKINEVKVPNLTGRSNWNYVKTINSNILGNIPQKDLQEIKSLFDNGLTLWHTTSNFLDYSQNNNIL